MTFTEILLEYIVDRRTKNLNISTISLSEPFFNEIRQVHGLEESERYTEIQGIHLYLKDYNSPDFEEFLLDALFR